MAGFCVVADSDFALLLLALVLACAFAVNLTSVAFF